MPQTSRHPRLERQTDATMGRALTTLNAAHAADALEDFDYEVVIDALQSTHAELSAALAESRARMMSKALEIYYAAEELARDPAHADIAKHVQEMREAYEQQFGMAVPERGR